MATMNQFDVHSIGLAEWNEERGNKLDMINDEVFANDLGKDKVVDDDEQGGEDNDETVNDDDDDDSHDKNAHLKQLRPGNNGVSSIRRHDSFTSFLTRSERNLILGKDSPPTELEASKRRIRFRETLVDIIEFDKIGKDVKNQYWMTDEDFDRIETDVKMTQFRFENSKSGKIPFDEANNSIRGLESILYGIDLKLYKHRQSVLQEIHQQKLTHGFVNDWERVRHTSEVNSDFCRSKALETGKQDEMEHRKAWNLIANSIPGTGNLIVEKTPATPSVAVSKNGTKKKNPLLFWKN